MKRAILAFLAVLATVGSAVGVTTTRFDAVHARPQAPSSPVSFTPLTTGSRICPDPSGVPGHGTTRVTALTAPGTARGRVTVAGIDHHRATTLQAAGRAVSAAGTRADLGPVPVTATGGLAAGFDADQGSYTDSGPLRGLAAASCPSPATDFTFVGVGTRQGEDPLLRIVNPRDTPAIVDVTLRGTHGVVASSATSGLSVPAHSKITVRLIAVAPDQPALGVSVHATTGRVIAALSDFRRDGTTAQGFDWVPPAAQAATRLVVPGVFQQAGSRVLDVVNPAATTATVRIQVTRSDGTFVPAGLSSVTVAAGAIRAVDISRTTDGHPAAITVTSDQRVFAGVAQTVPGSSGIEEVAFSAAAPALRGTALVGLSVDSAVRRVAGLIMSAPGGAASVTVRDLDAPHGASSVIPIKGGTTGVVNLTRLLQRTDGSIDVAVSAAAGSAPIYVAAYWFEAGSRGGLLSVLPLTAPPSVVVVPPARPDEHAADVSP